VQLGLDGQACEAISIDSREWPRVVYVKVDVEGAEPLAFYGMRNLLARNLPHILFEDRPDRRLNRATLDAMKVEEEVRSFSPRLHLESLGYQIGELGLDYIGRPPAILGSQQNMSSPDARDIPKRIFQTWKVRSPLPSRFKLWSDSIREMHPNYHYDIWDDDDNRSFISENFPWFLKHYNSYPREIYRADAIRYFYLFAFGGFYMDMDVICLKSLDSYLSQGDVLLGRMGPNPDESQSIPNAIMASRPRQNFWLFVIFHMMQRFDQTQGVEWHTGPGLLKFCVDRWLALGFRERESEIAPISELLSPDWRDYRYTERLVVLPSRQWYPIDWTDPLHTLFRNQKMKGEVLTEEEKRTYFPQSGLVTFWTQSWGGQD
jgi:mannosyltransferase OCH1-like enzyme